MNKCIAYLDDGTICGAPAPEIDPARGGTVCYEHRRKIQTPACDRCTQGVMDMENAHRRGTCKCGCHE